MLVPIEWVAISAAVLPHIKKYASERAGKLAGKYADGVLSKTYRRFVPDEKLIKANEAFVAKFDEELDLVLDLKTVTGSSYEEALKAFLKNGNVQDLIQAPLDGESDLDWQLLRGMWSESRTYDGQPLIGLGDFDWPHLAKAYKRAIQKQMLGNSELRPVIQALAEIRAAEAAEHTAASMERLVGLIRAFDLASYAKAVKTAYAYLKFGSLDADWTTYEGRVRLENVYVPQSVKQALPPRDLTRDYLRQLREEKREYGVVDEEEEREHLKNQYVELVPLPLMEVVDGLAYPRLVILGDPGLGKSTLLKHLALRWAENPSTPPVFLIELRKTVDYENFLDYLEKAASATCRLPQLELHNYLREHPALVLFDGLDEVKQGSRDDTVSKIVQFSSDYPSSRLIVTTRIHGYHPGSQHPEQFRDAGFQQFTLQDFDDREIGRFIQQWHLEAFSDVTERGRYESRLRNAIDDSPAIRELAANPLLLTLMAILNRNQDLPRDRGKLYERCAELLLRNWDLEKFPELKEKKDARDIKDKLGPDQKMRILEQVAAAMQKERTGLEGNLISEENLGQIVRQELSQLGIQQAWAVAEDLIWMLRERNFMLGYLGDRQYAFIHRTFLEYFCARDFKYRLEKTSSFTAEDLKALFRQHWPNDAWREPLRLICGLVGVEYAASCVSELLSVAQNLGSQDAVFLAAQCLREVREVRSIRNERDRTRRALLRLVRFDLAYFYEPEEPGARAVVQVRTRAVEELARGWKDDPEVLLWLKERAVSDPDNDVRRAAVQQLARGWKDDPEVLPLLKERAVGDPDNSVRAAAVQQLARGWKDDPEVLPMLKERAVGDPDNSVRAAAMLELAIGWKDDSEVLPMLKERAVGDPDNVVRMVAVLELARDWKDDPEVLAMLKERAVGDPDSVVRMVGVLELARGWKDDPEVLPMLKERAVGDPNNSVRASAVRELARGWKDDSEVLLLLKERAVGDPDEVVRAAAVVELARGWKDDPEVLRWLKEGTVSDENYAVRRAAVVELARGWKDDPEVLPMLKERAVSDENYAVRRAAVVELARGWKDDPEVLPMLKERAVSDPDSVVRMVGVLELARGWKDDPEVLPMLKQRAVSDPGSTVRWTAVENLAGGWKDDLEVLPMLKERAVGDPDNDVRRAALQELARGWKDDPEVLPMLKQRALGDEDSDVRQAALQNLARGWKDDPEVLPMLKQRALGDESWAVRQAALQELARGWKDDPAAQEILAKAKSQTP